MIANDLDRLNYILMRLGNTIQKGQASLQILFGSLGIFVVRPRIFGYECAYAHSYPKMRPSSWKILETCFLKILYSHQIVKRSGKLPEVVLSLDKNIL